MRCGRGLFLRMGWKRVTSVTCRSGCGEAVVPATDLDESLTKPLIYVPPMSTISVAEFQWLMHLGETNPRAYLWTLCDYMTRSRGDRQRWTPPTTLVRCSRIETDAKT